MNPLTLENLKQIARLQLNQVVNRLKQKGINLTVPNETLDKLTAKANVKEFGARPLRRLIQDHIEEPLAEMIISGKIKSGDTVNWTPDKLSDSSEVAPDSSEVTRH